MPKSDKTMMPGQDAWSAKSKFDENNLGLYMDDLLRDKNRRIMDPGWNPSQPSLIAQLPPETLQLLMQLLTGAKSNAA